MALDARDLEAIKTLLKPIETDIAELKKDVSEMKKDIALLARLNHLDDIRKAPRLRSLYDNRQEA